MFGGEGDRCGTALTETDDKDGSGELMPISAVNEQCGDPVVGFFKVLHDRPSAI
jgi:hypothetical protein